MGDEECEKYVGGDDIDGAGAGAGELRLCVEDDIILMLHVMGCSPIPNNCNAPSSIQKHCTRNQMELTQSALEKSMVITTSWFMVMVMVEWAGWSFVLRSMVVKNGGEGGRYYGGNIERYGGIIERYGGNIAERYYILWREHRKIWRELGFGFIVHCHV